MSARAATARDRQRLLLAAGCLLACAIAWVTPFDLGFAALSLGSPPLRAAMMIAITLAGAAMAGRVGLQVTATGLRRPILTPIAVAAVTAVYCVAIDRIMRDQTSDHYRAILGQIPLGVRILAFAARAFNENIIYRLFLGSLLVWLFGRLWRTPAGAPRALAYVTGFTVSQLVNIWINVTALAPLTSAHLLHDALRYVTPGLVWSWLYWRHGFQSNEIACTSVHLVMQPLLTL